MPQLALPFALVGAAGGWLSAGFLSNPLIHVILTGQQRAAAICSAVAAALVGLALTRWCGRVDPFAGPHVMRFRLCAAVILGGAVSGGCTGAAESTADGVLSGMVNGALCSIAFLPICAAVLAAARRAERARLGSIVAGADRREVWAILAAALSVATLAALPDWPASQSNLRLVPMPDVALEMAISAGLLTFAILLDDALAFIRVARATRRGLAERDPADLAAGTTAPQVDLGLGDIVLAQVSREAAAYRSRERATALVLGSPEEARAALRRALRRGALGLAVSVVVVGSHGLAATGGRPVYEEIRCSTGVLQSCREAGFLRQIDGRIAQAVELHEKACAGGEPRSCAALGDIFEADADKATYYRAEACDRRDAVSCRELARIKLRARPQEGTYDAMKLLARACSWGDEVGCNDLPAVEAGTYPRQDQN